MKFEYALNQSYQRPSGIYEYPILSKESHSLLNYSLTIIFSQNQAFGKDIINNTIFTIDNTNFLFNLFRSPYEQALSEIDTYITDYLNACATEKNVSEALSNLMQCTELFKKIHPYLHYTSAQLVLKELVIRINNMIYAERCQFDFQPLNDNDFAYITDNLTKLVSPFLHIYNKYDCLSHIISEVTLHTTNDEYPHNGYIDSQISIINNAISFAEKACSLFSVSHRNTGKFESEKMLQICLSVIGNVQMCDAYKKISRVLSDSYFYVPIQNAFKRKDLYKCQELLQSLDEQQVHEYSYRISTFSELILVQLMTLYRENSTIKLCENCHKPFIPKRPNNIYCDFKENNSSNTKCSSIGAITKITQKYNTDSAFNEYRRIQKRLYGRLNRAKHTENKTLTKRYEHEYSIWQKKATPIMDNYTNRNISAFDCIHQLNEIIPREAK